MNLARRSLTSSAYNITSSGIQTGILFIRSIVLARLLEPEIFGMYTLAASFVVISRSLPRFGMGSALLYRSAESEGEDALRTHFTLSLMFGAIWFVLLLIVGELTLSGTTLTALWLIAGAELFKIMSETGQLLLVRRVVFRRIAAINMLVALATSLGAILLAWRGFGIWSLVATDIISGLLFITGYYFYRPVWRPRIGWYPQVATYFVSFGSKSLISNTLLRVLDRLDDIWTGFVLGETLLGFYSRAYTFATYPRRVLARPLNAVAAGTYAEIKDDKLRLSQAFFRVNAFLVRVGFLFAGFLALVAPEFIRLVIGAKWLPMLTAFRLMLIYTMLDPLKVTIASLFVAVGKPEKTSWTRAFQLVILIIGLLFLGNRWGIAGVAVAVDAMVIVGIVALLWQARSFVNFSIIRLFAAPTLALIISMVLARAAILLPNILGSSWRTGFVKTVVFLPIYLGILAIVEYKDLLNMIVQFRNIIAKSIRNGDKTINK